MSDPSKPTPPHGFQRVVPPAPRENLGAVESMYQFILWLIPVLEGFPRSQKFLLGDRIQTGAMEVFDHLVEAAYTRDRQPLLRKANLGLEKLRFWLRMVKDLKLLDFKRWEYAARAVDDVGRQVGGWLKAQRTAAVPAPRAAGEGHAAPA